jgi:hypothetical protein
VLLTFQFFQPGKYLVGAFNTFTQVLVVGRQRERLRPGSHRLQDIVGPVLRITCCH